MIRTPLSGLAAVLLTVLLLPLAAVASPAGRTMPCDPNGGYPVAKVGCPDDSPETGNLFFSKRAGKPTLVFQPFHTYLNDAEGKAYAKKHKLHYPFDNDHYDAPTGPARPLTWVSTSGSTGATICTGISLVGHHKGRLKDVVVGCGATLKAAQKYHVPIAIWRDGDAIAQLSELFRP